MDEFLVGTNAPDGTILQRVKNYRNICTLTNNLLVSDKNALSVLSVCSVIDRITLNDRKKLSQFGHNVRKGRPVNTVTTSFNIITGRAGLKPMQPMQLHWAPRLWGPAPLGPRAMVAGKIVHFCQTHLALEN